MDAGDMLLALSLLGLVLTAVQHLVTRLHLRGRTGAPDRLPPVSILKPLCGVDEDLEGHLAVFASLDYPSYEVVLGVRDPADAAWPVAEAAVSRWPGRFRLVRQRGEPGLNPKVNQLIGLAREARHDVLVVSDSNVRVHAGYLREIAWHLRDDRVGLVTHPIAGVGERSLGAALENLQLSAATTPSMLAAKRLAGQAVVVGKSMALRRADLDAMGGFASVKDVLAEDFVLGRRVSRELGKRVVQAATPVQNVNQRRTLEQFLERYTRWHVMQRKIAGPIPYAAQILLHPVLFATLALAVSPSPDVLAGALAVLLGKSLLDEATARMVRGAGFGWRALLTPLRDLLMAVAWGRGFMRNTVEWRGTRLAVLPGSVLRPVEAAGAGGREREATLVSCANRHVAALHGSRGPARLSADIPRATIA